LIRERKLDVDDIDRLAAQGVQTWGHGDPAYRRRITEGVEYRDFSLVRIEYVSSE
jgi:hypothetical protein